MADKVPAARGRSVLVVLPSLAGGGAERMRLRLAKEFVARGFDVSIVLTSRGGELAGLVPVGVPVTSLNAASFVGSIIDLARLIRRQRPGCVLAAMWGLTVIAIVAHRLARRSGSVVVSEHEILSQSNMGRRKWLRQAMALSIRLTYPLANARIAVSEGAADDLATLSGIRRSSIRRIYNPALDPDVTVEPREQRTANEPRTILAVGSFKREKCFDLLIDAFAAVPETANVRLVILGDGTLRRALERQVADLGLKGRVELPGFQVDVSRWFQAADLFVLSSSSEGFGNVIVEALQHGVPVVSTDCPSGPREILADGVYGRLVPCNDPEALADAMLAALNEEPDREKLQRRAQEFAPEQIALEYLDAMFPGEGWLTAGPAPGEGKA